MAKLTDKEILTYIKDNNLEENLEYGIERGQDYIAHDLSCSSRKDAYRTYEDARKALKQRHGRRANEKEIYKCSQCGYFHFTSKANSNGIKKKGYERSSHRRKNIIRKTTENYGNNFPLCFPNNFVKSVHFGVTDILFVQLVKQIQIQ